ncbi:alpha/beta hydrolase [Sphingorhabdus lutea]|uniref:Alpha/beta hydrolase n=1 Tax=Sphingorhabdus lutea TaxID=1913578 RepID=A0A1L3JB44_9SPHN|nr:alpha/beta hydrolase [Sphingorhabdus lutea]APG62364.1 alpha/beta hydrolase [Sphingorhabdus lutea]
MDKFEDGIWWSHDGLRLHYRDYKQGNPKPGLLPPIICIPGLTRNCRDFEELAIHLSSRARVITVDLRGRGESGYAKDPLSYVPLTYVQDIELLLKHLAIDRFILIGTSLGGIVSMLLSSTRQGRVAGLILNDIGPKIETEGLERIKSYVGQGRSHETWVHAGRALEEAGADIHPDFTLEDWIKFAKKCFRLTKSGRIDLDYDMKIAEPFRVPGGETGVDLWPAFKALADIPTLIIRGETSDILSQEIAEKMQAQLRKATLEIIPKVGHCPTLEEKSSLKAIKYFLDNVKKQEAAIK